MELNTNLIWVKCLVVLVTAGFPEWPFVFVYMLYTKLNALKTLGICVKCMRFVIADK